MIRIVIKSKGGKNISELPLIKNRSMLNNILEKIHRDFVKYFHFAGMKRRSSDPRKVALKFELIDKSIVGISLYSTFLF